MGYCRSRNSMNFDPTATHALNRVARTERGIKRGDRYFVYEDINAVGTEQRKSRPCIIVSNNDCNKTSTTVEIVYLTTAIKTKALPTHTTIMGKHESIALCEQVHSVSIERLGRYLGSCSAEEMQEVNECLAISLGLNVTDTEQQIKDYFKSQIDKNCGTEIFKILEYSKAVCEIVRKGGAIHGKE